MYSSRKMVPTALAGTRKKSAMKMVVSENPAMATVFLPNFIERYVEHNTPITVTNWLDILNRLKPTDETLACLESTTSPKVFSRYGQAPWPLGLARPSDCSKANKRS